MELKGTNRQTRMASIKWQAARHVPGTVAQCDEAYHILVQSSPSTGLRAECCWAQLHRNVSGAWCCSDSGGRPHQARAIMAHDANVLSVSDINGVN